MKTFEPSIFVVGCPRSGTTLLQQLLDAHPRIAITPETHFMPEIWYHRQQFGDITSETGFHELVDYVRKRPEFGDLNISSEEFRQRAVAGERSFRSVFCALLEMYGEKSGKPIIGEKTPDHFRFIPTLAEWFPNARFVNIIRDPRAVACSWRSLPWSTGSIRGDALAWRDQQGVLRRQARRYRARMISIKYEDLVSQPELTMSKVFEFLSVAKVSAEQLAAGMSKSCFDVRREPWKQNNLKEISAAPTARWRQELTPQEVQAVESVVGDYMVLRGYQLCSGFWLPVARSIMTAGRQRLSFLNLQ